MTLSKTLTLAIPLICITSPFVHAMQDNFTPYYLGAPTTHYQKPTQIQSIDIQAPDIKSALSRVKELIGKGIKPQEILVVFDVDGTLTMDSTPDPSHTALPKNQAPQVIKVLSQMGVRIVISSAWKDFNQTKKTINELGLGFLLQGLSYMRLYERFNVAKAGSVVSVQDTTQPTVYYRKKAHAPRFVYPDAVLESVKRVIFCDDSSGNIEEFKNDMAEYDEYIYGSVVPVDYIEINSKAAPYEPQRAAQSRPQQLNQFSSPQFSSAQLPSYQFSSGQFPFHQFEGQLHDKETAIPRENRMRISYAGLAIEPGILVMPDNTEHQIIVNNTQQVYVYPQDKPFIFSTRNGKVGPFKIKFAPLSRFATGKTELECTTTRGEKAVSFTDHSDKPITAIKLMTTIDQGYMKCILAPYYK